MSSFMRAEVDADVVARAKCGDRAAHQAIYLAFARPVYRLVRRLMGSSALAEELLQDVFVEILTNCASYRGDGPFGAWVRRIAVRKCLMQIRSPWRRVRMIGESRSQDEELETLVHPGSHHDCAVLATIDIERAFARLEPLSRAVVWLHDVEGYTHGEIAEAFGRSISFSKSQLARAHARLREALSAREEVPPSCTHPSTIS